MTKAPWLEGHRFQKGTSGNVGGRPKLPEALRAISSLTQLEVCKLVSKYGRMTAEQLKVSAQDPATPMLELAIASIFASSVQKGDYTKLAFLLDRSIGKASEAPEPDDEELAIRAQLKELTNEELKRLVKQRMEELSDDT